MSDEQTRFPYKFGRVLIESERVITPTLPGVTLQLSGGQVEMLRNIVYHLGSRNTFVSEYFDIDYEAPDDDDWETITTLVADLEYKLMGNENVPWGFNDGYVQRVQELDAVVNDYLESSTVPAYKVYVVQSVTAKNLTNDFTLLQVFVMYGAVFGPTLIYQSAPVANTPYTWNGSIALMEGMFLRAYYNGNTVGDDLDLSVCGYKMVV